MNILYIDIETAPIEAYTWGTFDQTVGLNQIIKPWGLLSAAWMWEGEEKVKYQDNRNAVSPRDDQELVAKCHELLDEADIVVTQNGKQFDIRRLNARFIEMGMAPPSPFKQVDTKEVAKRVAWFVSNKLEWLGDKVAHRAKDRHAAFPGFELWSEVLKNNRKAWREMEKYNKEDVLVLRELYLQLLPWIPNPPNMGHFVDTDEMVCPKCGSDDMNPRGFAYTGAGKYQRYQCGGCAGWSRGANLVNSKEKRRALLRGV